MAEVMAYLLNVGEAVAAYRSYQFPAGRERKIDRSGLVNPPLDLDRLAEFYNESTWHRNAVRVKARDMVGHGWTLEREFEEGADPPGSAAEKEVLDSFFWNGAIEGFANSDDIDPPMPLYLSTSEVMERVVIDQDTIGNGYLAVIREDRAVELPRWYAQVQASKMRPHKDRVRFKWQDGRTNYLWFKRFGAPVDVHVKTGEVRPLDSLPVLERASEVIHFATYAPTDDYYGLPNITPAIGAMVLDLLARDFNVKFLDNNAIPQYAVIMEGIEEEDVPEETRDTIRDFFATARGNPGRTLGSPRPPAPPGRTPPSVSRSWRWRSGRATSTCCGRTPGTRSWWPMLSQATGWAWRSPGSSAAATSPRPTRYTRPRRWTPGGSCWKSASIG